MTTTYDRLKAAWERAVTEGRPEDEQEALRAFGSRLGDVLSEEVTREHLESYLGDPGGYERRLARAARDLMRPEPTDVSRETGGD